MCRATVSGRDHRCGRRARPAATGMPAGQRIRREARRGQPGLAGVAAGDAAAAGRDLSRPLPAARAAAVFVDEARARAVDRRADAREGIGIARRAAERRDVDRCFGRAVEVVELDVERVEHALLQSARQRLGAAHDQPQARGPPAISGSSSSTASVRRRRLDRRDAIVDASSRADLRPPLDPGRQREHDAARRRRAARRTPTPTRRTTATSPAARDRGRRAASIAAARPACSRWRRG